MKQWKKPGMITKSITEITKYIQANAFTCIIHFVR